MQVHLCYAREPEETLQSLIHWHFKLRLIEFKRPRMERHARVVVVASLSLLGVSVRLVYCTEDTFSVVLIASFTYEDLDTYLYDESA
jgi:hypothetical protein